MTDDITSLIERIDARSRVAADTPDSRVFVYDTEWVTLKAAIVPRRRWRPLRLVGDHDVLAGVVGGFAYRYGLPVTECRIVLGIAGLLTGVIAGVIVYGIAYLLMDSWDEDPADFDEVCG